MVIDDATQARLFGLYARVLVDVDLLGKLFDYVLVKREGHAFPIGVRHIDFCFHCKAIRHHIQQCKKISSIQSKEGSVQGVKKASVHQPKPSISSKVSFSNKCPEPTINLEAGSSALTASKGVQQHVSTLVTYAEGKHNEGNTSAADKTSDLNIPTYVAITKKKVTFSSASYE